MNSPNPEIFIPIDKTKSVFNAHLKLSNNNRILFSSKYGSGKTTFLKKFYEEKDNVNVFHLFPVNYQVADNKDIFELIKFDILTILVENDLVVKDENLGHLLSLQSYIMTDGANYLWESLKKLPKLGKAFKSLEKLIDFFTCYNQYQEDLNLVKENAVQKYLDEIKKQKGNLYEVDYITFIIRISIQNQKSVNKENILIIDDLDRMDPAHIFRIMNIFSAHFDQMNQLDQEDRTENKFGFDRIIMVCDIDNIRNLFHSFYGIDTDFGGYIDKFFSMRIFEFSLKKSILEKIEDIFIPYGNNYPQSGGSLQLRIGFARPIIKDFIEINAINFRTINNIKIGAVNFKEPYNVPNVEAGLFRSYSFIYVQVIDFLYNIFGCDFSKLLQAIKKAQELKLNQMEKHQKRLLLYLIPLLQGTFNESKKLNLVWNYPSKLDTPIIFNLKIDDSEIFYAEIINDTSDKINLLNFYEMLEIVLFNMKKQGYFDLSLAD